MKNLNFFKESVKLALFKIKIENEISINTYYNKNEKKYYINIFTLFFIFLISWTLIRGQ